jgi:hypothetical protein
MLDPDLATTGIRFKCKFLKFSLTSLPLSRMGISTKDQSLQLSNSGEDAKPAYHYMRWNCDEVMLPSDRWNKGEKQEYCCKKPLNCTANPGGCERLLKISHGNGDYADWNLRWLVRVEALGKAYVGCLSPAQTFYE